MILKLALAMAVTLISKNQLTNEELKNEISKTTDEILNFHKKRSFKNDSDLAALKKMRDS